MKNQMDTPFGLNIGTTDSIYANNKRDTEKAGKQARTKRRSSF